MDIKIKDLHKYVETAALLDTFKYLPRLSTKRIPIHEKGTVSDHIYDMMCLAYLTHDALRPEFKAKLDLLKIFKLILLHELDEALTNDIPYPMKKTIKECGESSLLDKLKEITAGVLRKILPESFLSNQSQVISETIGQSSSNEKQFVKLLDYVHLYLSSYRLSNSGYPMELTMEECATLTRQHPMYGECRVIQYLMDYPEDFVNKEFN